MPDFTFTISGETEHGFNRNLAEIQLDDSVVRTEVWSNLPGIERGEGRGVILINVKELPDEMTILRIELS